MDSMWRPRLPSLEAFENNLQTASDTSVSLKMPNLEELIRDRRRDSG